jgi:hypothetical protein
VAEVVPLEIESFEPVLEKELLLSPLELPELKLLTMKGVNLIQDNWGKAWQI